MNWISVFRSKKGLSKAHMHQDQTGLNPLSFLFFYSILSLCTLNKESKEALTSDCIQTEQLHVCAIFLVKIQWFHILFIPTPPLLLLILVLLISHYNFKLFTFNFVYFLLPTHFLLCFLIFPDVSAFCTLTF
jgi:hypothetical protein